MSWSLFLSDLKAEDFVKTIDETMPSGGDGSHETNNQVGVARQLAVRIFESGQLGEPTADTLYMVSLSGHANPDHALVGAGASESIGVNVSRYVPTGPVFSSLGPESTMSRPIGAASTAPAVDGTIVSGEVEMAARSQLMVASASVVQLEPVVMQLSTGHDESNDPDDDKPIVEAPAETPEEA
jgi:hypothetical protein